MTFENEAITQVASNVFYLDSRRVTDFGVSGVYLVVGDGITLIETGTTLVAPFILKAVDEIGFAEEDIKRAVVTHIHLDHAGATGWLVRRLPHLQVYVHERGLKHLLNPSKLIDSAKTVYGNLENILAIHGDILPVDGGNLVPVRDTRLDIGGGVELEIFDAPGHASHHLCLFEPDSGCLFSGEALGHQHPENGVLLPAVAPPGFDYEASLETVGKIRDRQPQTVCFSQFGQRRDTSAVMETSERQLRLNYELLLDLFKREMDTQKIMDEVMKAQATGDENHDILLHGSLMSLLAGYRIYFDRSGLLG
ncbi:MAG: MBL fold metallo-hydrolase [Proteobacteria bacterium]|nr:MBL fold metallo-hydrolase [Pseudomonadota bacterium]